jgi:hypothetical protein
MCEKNIRENISFLSDNLVRQKLCYVTTWCIGKFSLDFCLMPTIRGPLGLGIETEHTNTYILWHVNPLLGNDREISNYTTAITK